MSSGYSEWWGESLIAFCYQEIDCLENNYDDIPDGSDCKAKLEEFIKDEDRDLNLDYILMKSCEPVISEYCEVSQASVYI